MQNKRINLYSKFRERSDEGFDKKYKNFSEWEKINFSDEPSVEDIWNKALRAKDKNGDKMWGSGLTTFYQTFACDLEWAKKTNYCPKPPAPTPPPKPPFDPKQDMDTSAKRTIPPIKEQISNAIRDAKPQFDLTLAVRNNCFSQYGATPDPNYRVPTEMRKNENEFAPAVVARRKDGSYIYFFEDGIAIDISLDGKKEIKTWNCSSLGKTTSLTAYSKNLTPDQREWVNRMVKLGNFQLQKPNDYELSQGMWEKVDLYNLEKSTLRNSNIFPNPNEYFGYIQKGYLGTRKNQYNTILQNLEKNGYTLDEPDIDTPAYSFGKPLSVVFPKYSKYFKPEQQVYYKGASFSQEYIEKATPIIKKIKDDLRLGTANIDNPTCKDALKLLWDAKQAYFKNLIYFQDESDIDIVRDYVKRCSFKESNKYFRELVNSRHNEEGANKFNLHEATLSNLIKKRLIEMKRKKEGLIS